MPAILFPATSVQGRRTLTPPPITTNLKWWLDARAGVSGPAPRVVDWQDQWSGNYDFEQGAGADQPQTSTAGGKPSIQFTASNTEFMAAAGSATLANTRFLHSGPSTVVIACRLSTVAALGTMLGSSTAGATSVGYALEQSNTATSLRWRIGNGTALARNVTIAGVTLDSNIVLSARNNATQYSVRQNGSSLAAASAAATLVNSDAAGLPRFGALSNGSDLLNGHLGIVLAWDAYLSDGDVGSVETWASAIWV
jgi:hypothetical protein